jgi:Uncharacterized protein conserved in bacteria (DUF2188)
MPSSKRLNVPGIEVEPRTDGRWAVKTQGASRASRVLDRKADAVGLARERARRHGAELIVKDATGKIKDRDSHGRDSRRRPG